MKEKQAFHINGYLGLVGLIVIIGIGSWGVFAGEGSLVFWKVSWNQQSKLLIHYNAVDAKNPGVFEGKKFQ